MKWTRSPARGATAPEVGSTPWRRMAAGLAVLAAAMGTAAVMLMPGPAYADDCPNIARGQGQGLEYTPHC